MEYSEIKAFLNDTPQYGETTGVERAGKLLELLGNPDKNLKIIHIAGTNGKGSVCSYIDDILKKRNYCLPSHLYFKIVENSSQICQVKYDAYSDKYSIHTDDGYHWEVKIYQE